MIISSPYASFSCKTCGEMVYSPVLTELREGSASLGDTLELSCSSGHTEQYKRDEVVIVSQKPAFGLRSRFAIAAGG